MNKAILTEREAYPYFRPISTHFKTACRSVMARLADISLYTRLLSKGLILALILITGIIYPNKAAAGLSSFASSFFTNTTEAADTPNNEPRIRTINSQNVALLLASASSDPTSSVEGLPDINIVNSSALIADSGPLGTIADVEEADPGPDTISIYVVREGDTVQKIAKMFGVSVNTVLWGNDLRSAKDIKLGQELVILPITGIKYVVKKGDTLLSIAKRHGGDLDEILRFNNLDKSKKLSVGDEILIPNGVFKAGSPVVKGITEVIKTYIDESIDVMAYYIRPVINGRKTQGLHGKNGIDIASGCKCAGKEPVLASAGGKVIVAKSSGWSGGYGNYVVISHSNGTQTLYGHMHSVSVYSGENVTQGQMIGTIGSSGNSTGPHLHFEIRGAKNPF